MRATKAEDRYKRSHAKINRQVCFYRSFACFLRLFFVVHLHAAGDHVKLRQFTLKSVLQEREFSCGNSSALLGTLFGHLVTTCRKNENVLALVLAWLRLWKSCGPTHLRLGRSTSAPSPSVILSLEAQLAQAKQAMQHRQGRQGHRCHQGHQHLQRWPEVKWRHRQLQRQHAKTGVKNTEEALALASRRGFGS